MHLKPGSFRPIGVGIVLMLGTLPAACREREAEPRVEPLVEFQKRIEEYAALQRRLAEKVGPLDQTKSQEEIAARAATLGHLIKTERGNAKQGDIFTSDVAELVTAIVQRENSGRTAQVQEVRDDNDAEHRTDGLPDFVPQVNEVWPTAYPLPTFPAELLPLLPKLPPEVEYRIATHYLVLRDVESNLIIDFIPHAVGRR